MDPTLADRRHRFKRRLWLMLPVAIAIGLLFGLYVRAPVVTTAAKPRVRAAPPPEAVAADLPAERLAPPERVAVVAPHPRIAAPRPEAENPPPPPVADSPELAEIREAILRATPRALRRGRPVTWEAGDASGYVVPSEEGEEDEGRICRNVYATNIAGERQDQGQVHRWCRPADGGDWAPA